jgi:hypothetical protein
MVSAVASLLPASNKASEDRDSEGRPAPNARRPNPSARAWSYVALKAMGRIAKSRGGGGH